MPRQPDPLKEGGPPMIQLNSSLTILIAEQTFSVAEAIAQSLAQNGYRVVGMVHTTDQAIETAILQVPDIVLMNVSLAGTLDSLTAAQQIYDTLNCPVVYLSTLTKPLADIEGTQLVPIHGSLVKPFTADALDTEIVATLAAYRAYRLQQATTTNPIPLDTPDTALELGLADQWLLRLLAVASQMLPIPRIFFQAETLIILTETTDSARSLSDFCQAAQLPYSYQIFTWQWQHHQYLPYDHAA